jgi:AmmeMemoRadiSam system protein B
MVQQGTSRHWVRPPAVAGAFYPADADVLRQMLEQFAAQVRLETMPPPPCAVIAPHAGYVYSGPVAAYAYAPMQGASGQFERVILIGPSHRLAFSGLAVSSADAFDCPLGQVPLDREAIAELLDLTCVRCLDQAHAQEHGLEVHLPFLITTLDARAHPFSLVPIVVGDASAQEVAAALGPWLCRPRTLIVVSSDLSHYLDYEAARRMDRQTASAIEALTPQHIGPEQACGRVAIQGLLHLAQAAGLKARTLDLRNSGDTAGPRDRVVGYGAFVLHA